MVWSFFLKYYILLLKECGWYFRNICYIFSLIRKILMSIDTLMILRQFINNLPTFILIYGVRAALAQRFSRFISRLPLEPREWIRALGGWYTLFSKFLRILFCTYYFERDYIRNWEIGYTNLQITALKLLETAIRGRTS